MAGRRVGCDCWRYSTMEVSIALYSDTVKPETLTNPYYKSL